MLARFFVDRPIFATVLSLVVVILGLVSMTRLPIAQYPEVAPPTIQVTAVYPGAGAVEVARTCATVIEEQINGVENMLYMSSRCGNDGVMTIDVTFELGTNLDDAQVLVQNRVSIAQPRLPEEVRRQGVTTKKRSPNILLVVNMVTVETNPQSPLYRDSLYLSNFAQLNIKDALSRIPGVGDVTFFGAREFSMRIWLDPEKMSARELNVGDIARALQQQNIQVAAGRIGQAPLPAGNETQLVISTQGRLLDPEEFGDVVIKTGSEGQVVRLREVARIERGAKNYDVSSFLDGRESVGIPIFQRPGSNALATAEQIKSVMEELKRTKNFLGSGVDYRIVYDTTVFIEESITGVYHTLIEAFVLVFIVVLLFLQDWRAVILPMIDVPVSLIGTFGLMALFGFSLNNLTLFGLVLAIGIVVDDAIVVVENVESWLARGLNAREATLRAMSEVTGPIIAITLVLASVFIPTAFIAGINGQFYRQFALTIAASTAISAMNAMTMTPSRTAQIFKSHQSGHGHRGEALPWWGIGGLIAFLLLYFFSTPFAALAGIELGGHSGTHAPGTPPVSPAWQIWLFRVGVLLPALAGGWWLHRPVNDFLRRFFAAFNWCFEKTTAVYGKAVTGCLRVSVVMLLLYGGLMFFTYIGFGKIPTGFIPEQDKGYLIVAADLPDGASLERTEEVMRRIAEIISADNVDGQKAVANTISVPGFSLFTGMNLSNAGTMFLPLRPFAERQGNSALGAAATQQRLLVKLRELQEAFVLVLNAPAVDGIGNAGGVKLQVKAAANQDFSLLQDAVDQLSYQAMQTPGFGYPFSSFRSRVPQLYLEIDRTKAKAAGVELNDLFATLQGYLGSYYVNDYTDLDRNWQVLLQADQPFRKSKSDIGKLKVRNRDGKMVPLDAVMVVRDITGPAQVAHYQMANSADIIFNINPALMSTGQAISIVDGLAEQMLPPGMSNEWTELALQQVLASKDLLSKLVFPLAVLFVYLVLAALYESWIMPLAVILIVPMCISSALAGLFWTGSDNNIFTQIGLVVLIALASKNAILIVEFARQLEDQGKSTWDAVIEACRLRLRPILMTSLAFILGVVPLARAEGAGSEMRTALGVAVLAGMIGVTIFGVFFTPVFYYLLSKYSGYRSTIKSDGPEPPVGLIPAVENPGPTSG